MFALPFTTGKCTAWIRTIFRFNWQLPGLKEGFRQAKPQLLEPIYSVEILCPDADTGDVMGDLQTRRALISGMDSEGHYQKILAEIPLAEMHDYGSTLRSITGGRAKFTMKFSEYQLVPPNVQQDLVKKHENLQED